jgi:subtilisin-like proprotein convertase family protein
VACGAFAAVFVAVTSNAPRITIPISFKVGEGGPGSFASSDIPKAIPDNNATGVTSDLVLAGPGTISDVNVTIGSVTHTWISDLQVELKSPAGTIVRLFDRRGSNGDNLTNTVFDDAAGVAISAGAAPFTGAFKPEQALSAFNGQPVAGTWQLTVRDLAVQDTGTLNSWSVQRRLLTCP